MRVLILTHQYPRPEQPTSGVFVREQAAALRHAGVDIRVLAAAEVWLGPSRPYWSLANVYRFAVGAPAVRWREEYGLVFGTFPTIVVGRLGGSARAVSYAWGFRRVLEATYRDFPFDLVHAHTALLDGGAALEAKNRVGTPFILTEHTGPFDTLTKTNAMRRRVRKALVQADRVLAVSRSLRRAIQEVYPDLKRPIEIVPNGVDSSVFYPRKMSPGKEPPTVLWIGYLGMLKRPLLALSGYTLALRQIPNLRLRMIGRGPLERDLRLAVVHRNLVGLVSIEDFQDRHTLALSVASAQVLLVTSSIETFSLVTAEALSSGVPVVSTRCGGPEELIAKPWLGRLVDDAPEAVADALVSVIRGRGGFPADRLHAYAVKQFGFDVVAERIRAVYEEVIRSRAGVCWAEEKKSKSCFLQ